MGIFLASTEEVAEERLIHCTVALGQFEFALIGLSRVMQCLFGVTIDESRMR